MLFDLYFVSNKVDLRAVKITQLGEISWKNFLGGEIFDFLENSAPLMNINSTDLLLIDPTEMTVLHKQSIPSIRVWGVGRENSRLISDRHLCEKEEWMFLFCIDFDYVAKDKDRSVRIYKCHIFRCDDTSA